MIYINILKSFFILHSHYVFWSYSMWHWPFMYILHTQAHTLVLVDFKIEFHSSVHKTIIYLILKCCIINLLHNTMWSICLLYMILTKFRGEDERANNSIYYFDRAVFYFFLSEHVLYLLFLDWCLYCSLHLSEHVLVYCTQIYLRWQKYILKSVLAAIVD